MKMKPSSYAWIAAGIGLGLYLDDREKKRCEEINRPAAWEDRKSKPCKRGWFYTTLIGGSVTVGAIIDAKRR